MVLEKQWSEHMDNIFLHGDSPFLYRLTVENYFDKKNEGININKISFELIITKGKNQIDANEIKYTFDKSFILLDTLAYIFV